MVSIRDLDTEEKCQNIVEEIILGEGRPCPYCKNELQAGSTYLWCPSCRKKIRPKAFTWLRGSKVTYRNLFLLLIGWLTNAPPGPVKNLTGISYTTTCRWYSRFRLHLPRDKTLLNGIVEVDESFWGKRKYGNQKIVIGVIDRRKNEVRLEEIPDREQHSLECFLVATVHPESMVHSDCNPGYFDLKWYGYGSTLHNHSKGHFSGTNRIENVWSVGKRQMVRLYGRMQSRKLQEFIQEWEARWNYPNLFKCPVEYLKVTLVPS